VVSFYGGTSIVAQIEQLRRGVDVVVGTPGRLMDLLDRKKLNGQQVGAVGCYVMLHFIVITACGGMWWWAHRAG
jgi:hypothetical protein